MGGASKFDLACGCGSGSVPGERLIRHELLQTTILASAVATSTT
ncbi:MAG: hypothetical protein ACJA2W_000002 [Planctomycetota bacterium]|jgi:hypothetical protein